MLGCAHIEACTESDRELWTWNAKCDHHTVDLETWKWWSQEWNSDAQGSCQLKRARKVDDDESIFRATESHSWLAMKWGQQVEPDVDAVADAVKPTIQEYEQWATVTNGLVLVQRHGVVQGSWSGTQERCLSESDAAATEGTSQFHVFCRTIVRWPIHNDGPTIVKIEFSDNTEIKGKFI